MTGIPTPPVWVTLNDHSEPRDATRYRQAGQTVVHQLRSG